MAVPTFTVVIHKEDDLYVADCPEVGTVSQGYTIDEALANLKEATELYLEEVPPPGVKASDPRLRRSSKCELTTNTCSFSKTEAYLPSP